MPFSGLAAPLVVSSHCSSVAHLKCCGLLDHPSPPQTRPTEHELLEADAGQCLKVCSCEPHGAAPLHYCCLLRPAPAPCM
eukprot:CAMPEP_0202910230 /NCGR_PEP_ID=MMETSP1392-20130828/51505_1 /ASSEMBLY_ACC=CAM_ASM_000868 /TAXON_ID=225041 /ORGANISM="Chlamydomonas chlamydogama, Strain SAG 11-48b" /LENGTH=79 /DNA_ID=CAMNT_0049600283 /DNA_START=148 /DNA_END=384 /DNA_ORIENTATION=-